MSECTCKQHFMDAEDYRDHLPCTGSDEFNDAKSIGYKEGWNACVNAVCDRLMIINDEMGPRFCRDQVWKMRKQ